MSYTSSLSILIVSEISELTQPYRFVMTRTLYIPCPLKMQWSGVTCSMLIGAYPVGEMVKGTGQVCLIKEMIELGFFTLGAS